MNLIFSHARTVLLVLNSNVWQVLSAWQVLSRSAGC